ncbi:MAG TPA: CRISPR system precrRNA processing endoribonuclease RAMP protein Cas6 [Chthonomonadales bacterium]|nr:CRISPR system precrRNA processing endoribonuclease RAMP protein Cas6 [Chthonomonadales bacterium]
MFETVAPEDQGNVRGFEQFPRPYVISYPMSVAPPRVPATRAANAGRQSAAVREIGLTLVGRAGAHFPYLALALRDLENRGIGRGRGRFEIEEVVAIGLSGEEVVVYRDGTLHNMDAAIRGAEIGRLGEDAVGGISRLRVRFLSPTALKHGGVTAERPEFNLLIRNLLRRISMLALGHCDYRMEVDFGYLIRIAEQVGVTRNGTGLERWERHSRRQDRRVPMAGLVGEVEYGEGWQPFAPLLLLGTLTHVGDNCAFGMGRFVVGPEGEKSRWLAPGWQFEIEGKQSSTGPP